jgi:hypothetical protein
VTIPNATHVSFVGGDQAPTTAAKISAFADSLSPK